MKSVCSKCGRLCTPAYYMEIEGGKVSICPTCQQQMREGFLLMLAAGDPKANRIFNAVKLAAAVGQKKKEGAE